MATYFWTIRWTTAFVMTAVALLWVISSPALAKKSGDAPFLDGQVVNVGSGKPNGEVHLRGRVRGGAGDLDLGVVKLHVISFLSEPRGSVELVSAEGGSPLVPLHLSAKKGSSATEAVFKSESSRGGPEVRIAIARVPNTDEYDFSIKVQHVLIAADPACAGPQGTTERRSRLSLSDGVHPPVLLHIRHNWQCANNRLTNPTPVALGGEPVATPEQAVADMAFDLAKDVAGDQLNDFLFPDDFDYETLVKDFEEVVKEALAEEKILTDQANIQGFLDFLADQQSTYNFNSKLPNANVPQIACTTLINLQGQERAISDFVSQLEADGPAALSGWVSGAQTQLNFYQLLQNMHTAIAGNPACTNNLDYSGTLTPLLDQYLQYLVEQRNAILHKNILDSLHYCHQYNTNPNLWKFTNCTGAEHENLEGHAACEAEALNVERTSCAETTFDDQTGENSGSDGNVAWMEDVISNWRDALADMANKLSPNFPCAFCQDAHSAITVDSMFTGVHTAAPVETTAWVKAACDGKQSCDYQLEPINFAQQSDGQESTTAFQTVQVTYHCGSVSTPRIASLANVGNSASALYKGAYLHLDCAPRVTNFQATVKNQPVAVGVSDTDVSTNSHLDASKITDGILPSNGSNAGSTTNVIVLPHTQSAGALVINLGASVNICGNGFDCTSEPQIQADNDDIYQLDYSSDGVNWTKYGQFPTVSGSGLRTRTFNCNTRPNPSQPCSATNHGPNFSARYVRVFGVSGGATFSVSELSLWNTGSQLISVGKPAASNYVPLITNGIFAPAGTSWNNSTYATVLSTEGSTSGLAIDLGQVYGALDRVKIQADHNDWYQVDVSTDGATWFNWYSVPPVSAGGLQTRDSGPLPPSVGRYVRVYATRGDGEYSVSEVQVFANQAMPTCDGERVCGHSAATVLKGHSGATAQDVAVHWTCGSDTTPHTTLGVPWTVSRSGFSYPDSAVVQPSCPPTTVPCDPTLSFTCSHFAEDAPSDVVYTNALNIPYQLSNDHPQCEAVISEKTNFYRNNSSTKNDPACTNVQRAIHDAITDNPGGEGSCPRDIAGNDGGNGVWAWPYNVGIGGGATATTLVDPALGQPPLLLFVGCNSLLQ